MVVSMPVQNGMMSAQVLMAMTISSNAALPARSPSLRAHSTWRAPAPSPAKELGQPINPP